MMWGYDGLFGAGFGLFGGIFMLVWWALIIAGVVALVRWFSGSGCGHRGSCGQEHGRHGHADHDSAMDILAKRYARGEIDKAEFEEKRDSISQA